MSNQDKIDFTRAKFLKSAQKLVQCPPEEGREVAFAGRSNAGKSSALNTLTKNHKLARTSKTPGRTQLINFFALNEDHSLRLVDLPGYGFAKVTLDVKEEWGKHLQEYLNDRQTLMGVVLMMDIRHPLKEFDQEMINWCVDTGLPCHILLTKADKLKNGPAKNTLLKVQNLLKDYQDLITVQTFSSLKKTGLGELQSQLGYWLTAPIED